MSARELPSPEWVRTASIVMKTSIARVCRRLGQPQGIELLRLELLALQHDVLADEYYFGGSKSVGT